MPMGSIACWVFLSCLEVLQSCEKYTDSSNVENYSHYTASLWVYAQTKVSINSSQNTDVHFCQICSRGHNC